MIALNLSRRRRFQRRRGAVTVFVAFLTILIAAMAAFSVDVGDITVTRGTLRAAVDSAALAGAGELATAVDFNDVKATAVEYGLQNVPPHYAEVVRSADVTLGEWDPDAREFTPGGIEPNAVRVVLGRTTSRGNAAPFRFARVFGMNDLDIEMEAVAVGATPNVMAFSETYGSVYVTSSKDLSNVVLGFSDGTQQKFEPLSGYTGTFLGTGEHFGKAIVSVWIKSGCNHSNDGSGYGERIDTPEGYQGETLHGANQHKGCTPHVTATFNATGPQFSESGSISPVRLVK